MAAISTRIITGNNPLVGLRVESMTFLRFKLTAILTGTALALSGCELSPDALYQPGETDKSAEHATLSSESIAAAKSLSAMNNPSVAAATDPYKKALLCQHGIQTLVGKMLEMAEISDEQRRSADEASSYFKEYLDNAAKIAGKSDNEVKDDLEQLAFDQTDPGENVRIATACLKSLEAGNL